MYKKSFYDIKMPILKSIQKVVIFFGDFGQNKIHHNF